MTIVFAGQISVTTTAQNLATVFSTVPNCKRIVFSAESTTSVRVQVQAARFANAIIREINPTGATGIIDEHVIDGGGEWVNTADYSVASASATGKINVYGLG